jgi:hypothetical protein
MCLLLQLRPHFIPDRPTLAMAGNPPGLFAYICKLIHTPTGVIIGEGRGTADLSEKQQWTVNSAVKIATKRAQVDAVLRVAALSDFFTQDLEDGAEDTADRAYQAHQTQQQQRPREQPPERRAPREAAPNTPTPIRAASAPAGAVTESANGTPAPITAEDKAKIRKAVDALGWGAQDNAGYLFPYNVTYFSELTAEQAAVVVPDLQAKAAKVQALANVP